MEWPASQGSSGGKKRLWRIAFIKPKSMGFSVPLMSGVSEVMPSQRKKKPR